MHLPYRVEVLSFDYKSGHARQRLRRRGGERRRAQRAHLVGVVPPRRLLGSLGGRGRLLHRANAAEGARGARAPLGGACLEAELLEPALAGARGLEPDLLLAFWTAATRGRRADAPPATLCAWPALHALAIKDGAWLDASLSRQRLDELARLAADAASAVELLGELDARHAAAGDADLKQRPRLAAVAAVTEPARAARGFASDLQAARLAGG